MLPKKKTKKKKKENGGGGGGGGGDGGGDGKKKKEKDPFGSVAEPGLVATWPGRGVIITPPVSVCHHVSTMGQRLPPISRWYHIQASGLMGSPTVPKRRSEERSWRFGCWSPRRMKVRMAVGAV